MSVRSFVLSLVFLLSFLSLISQKTQRFLDKTLSFERATILFNNKNYSSAQKEFEEILKSAEYSEDQKSDARYYVGICALNLDQPESYSVELLEDFINKNPTHPKSKYASYEIATHYFHKKKFKEASQYYNQISLLDFEENLRNQGRFELGYSFFELKEYDLAEKNFDRVKNHDNKYRDAANYYSGYIKIKKKKYDEALSDFESASKSKSYASAVPVMITNIYYKTERYTELIAYASPIASSKQSVTNKREVMGLLAESYYKQSDYENAAKWYGSYTGDKYIRDSSIHYNYGYSSFQTEDYKAAIREFKFIAGKKDKIAQAASHYLGHSYLNNNQKEYALNAFKQASAAFHDEEITQDALYNEGKLHYDLKNYSSAISVFNYLGAKYPKHKKIEDVRTLVTESYLFSNDYEAAIEYIENISGSKNKRVRSVYQRVTNDKATKLFNSKKFKKSLDYFDKSISYAEDSNLKIESYFWKAEALSKLTQWDKAINTYARVFTNDPQRKTSYYYQSFYGIGYAYFYQKKYTKAKEKFKGYINSGIVNTSSSYYSSALARLGDCAFLNKSFPEARKYYNEIVELKSTQTPYALYGIGKTWYYGNNREEAITAFSQVINKYPRSSVYEKSLFQRSYIYQIIGEHDKTIDGFDKLIKTRPQSKLLPEAYYRRAASYKALEQYEKAVEDYDFIIENFCRVSIDGETALSENSIDELKDILINGGISNDAYEKRFNKAIACIPNIDVELKKYELIRDRYYTGDYTGVISGLNKFGKEFPNSKYDEESIFLLANSFYQIDSVKQAKELFLQVFENAPDNYYLESVISLNEIASREQDNEMIIKYSEIILTYDQLSGKQEAYLALMEANFELMDYENTIKYSNEILAVETTDPNATSKAQLYKAKSHYLLNDTTNAKQLFQQMEKEYKDEFGAEALFYLAKIKQDNGDYSGSNQLLLTLNSDYSSEKIWVSKSFLMIGDNYTYLEEDLQAKAVYESIVQYSAYPEIVAQAKQKIQALENKSLLQDSTLNVLDTLEIENKNE